MSATRNPIAKILPFCEDKNIDYPDRIAETFANKTIFITGGTGFLGKVLIEKLLRCCPALKKIYILIRSKYNRTVDQRMVKLFSSPLFEKLKQQSSLDFSKKIQAVQGDVSEENLGLSIEDVLMLENQVEIVYNCAANVRFDETLKTAININVKGTKFMLDLAKNMKNLLLFCHVSTAYCHLHERVIYEKAYDPPENPYKVLKIVENLNDSELSALSHKILGNIPNTYTYSKALAEGLINKEIENLPIMLLRPSFIIPIWKDPLPGWTDTINGMIGFEIASAKGILRTMHTDENNYTDFLPADVAINAFLFTVFEYLTYQKKLPLSERQKVHNLTTSSEHKVTWRDIKRIGLDVINERIPLNWVVWHPNTIMTTNYYLHQVLSLFLHLIPAMIIDPLLIFFGYGSILLKAHKKLIKGFDMMNYYGNNQWDFHNDWSLRSREILNPREREIYTLFGDDINYYDYFTDCVYAARRYILNESDDSIETAKRHLKIMYYVDLGFKTILAYFIFIKAWKLGLSYFILN